MTGTNSNAVDYFIDRHRQSQTAGDGHLYSAVCGSPSHHGIDQPRRRGADREGAGAFQE